MKITVGQNIIATAIFRDKAGNIIPRPAGASCVFGIVNDSGNIGVLVTPDPTKPEQSIDSGAIEGSAGRITLAVNYPSGAQTSVESEEINVFAEEPASVEIQLSVQDAEPTQDVAPVQEA